MKEFTVENMIDACKWLPDMKSRNELFENFRMMRFHGFIGEDVFEEFCKAWQQEFFCKYVFTASGMRVTEEQLEDYFRALSFVVFNTRDFEAWKSSKINTGVIKEI